MIEAYTDGGCSGNPGPGGWAYIISREGGDIRDSGGEDHTTNNRMELTAVIRALERLRTEAPAEGIRIHTDSQYVQLGITRWIQGWERTGWRTAGGDPVKNRDLWTRLRELSSLLRPEWVWVRGHAGNPLNEACDALVRGEMKKILNR